MQFNSGVRRLAQDARIARGRARRFGSDDENEPDADDLIEVLARALREMDPEQQEKLIGALRDLVDGEGTFEDWTEPTGEDVHDRRRQVRDRIIDGRARAFDRHMAMDAQTAPRLPPGVRPLSERSPNAARIKSWG